MTKWSNPECETRILTKLLLSKTYIFIVFLMWASPLVHEAIHISFISQQTRSNVPMLRQCLFHRLRYCFSFVGIDIIITVMIQRTYPTIIITITSKQYRFFRRNPSVPSRILLELLGNITYGFFLNNLYCL